MVNPVCNNRKSVPSTLRHSIRGRKSNASFCFICYFKFRVLKIKSINRSASNTNTNKYEAKKTTLNITNNICTTHTNRIHKCICAGSESNGCFNCLRMCFVINLFEIDLQHDTQQSSRLPQNF